MSLRSDDVEILDESQVGVCGATGCTDPVAEVVRHPSRGEIYVCESCGAGFETVSKVIGGEQS